MSELKKVYSRIRNSILREIWFWSLQWPGTFMSWKQKAAYAITKKCCPINYAAISENQEVNYFLEMRKTCGQDVNMFFKYRLGKLTVNKMSQVSASLH